METLSNLAFGLGVALSWQNVLYCFIGCFLGTLVGVLPGIGPVATVAMLLPFTFGLNPAPALIMLAGIYYGAQYGGSTTAILVNIPGESSSVVTTLDGHQMARRGRAPGPHSASPRSAPSSPAASRRWSSPISPRRSPSSRSNSVPRNISRSWCSG
jgi:putative tricarboxylic transport membrane protein